MRKRLFAQICDTAVPDFQVSALRLKVCKQGEVTQLLHFHVDHDMKSRDNTQGIFKYQMILHKGSQR